MEQLISTFCEEWSSWPGFGQALFIFIILGGIGAGLKWVFFYTSVWFRGWPPEHTKYPESLID